MSDPLSFEFYQIENGWIVETNSGWTIHDKTLYFKTPTAAISHIKKIIKIIKENKKR